MQSQKQEWQLWLWQDHAWLIGRDKRVLGDGRVDVDGEGDADGVAAVADDVVDDVADGEGLTVGESVLFQRGIQC